MPTRGQPGLQPAGRTRRGGGLVSTGAMRRAQLVSPFGVGAMSILVNGTSVITAGLDHWYKPDDRSTLAIEQYTEHDWRLEERLGVREFRLPPDYRFSSGSGDNRNLRLTDRKSTRLNSSHLS